MSSVESYKHRYAKKTVAQWIRKRCRIGEKFKGLQPLVLPINSDGPMFGVYEEWPVTEELGLRCNHDTPHPHPWACCDVAVTTKKHGVPCKRDFSQWNRGKKTEEKLSPTWYFDVALVDSRGSLAFVFEIKHKHAMCDEKIAWLNENGIPWVELDADWVLERVKSPYDLSEGIIRNRLDRD